MILYNSILTFIWMQYVFVGIHRTINIAPWFLRESAPTKQLILGIQHNRVVKCLGSEVKRALHLNPGFTTY